MLKQCNQNIKKKRVEITKTLNSKEPEITLFIDVRITRIGPIQLLTNVLLGIANSTVKKNNFNLFKNFKVLNFFFKFN